MAGRNRFDFKRFGVEQEGCAMKVGTDGVLLGAWCRIESSQDKALLDIGTGTGVIALQLAQRTEGWGAKIDAVEIDETSCRRAAGNFDSSPWGDRLTVYRSSIQDFRAVGYDHIVSNPPYFVDSLSSPDASRTIARHSSSLSYDDLMKCCFKLLKPAGRISLIVPAGAETEKMIAVAADHDFVVSRRTDLHSTPRSGPKRTMLELVRRRRGEKAENTIISTVLTIEGDKKGDFSEEYRTLTRDFYLYF